MLKTFCRLYALGTIFLLIGCSASVQPQSDMLINQPVHFGENKEKSSHTKEWELNNTSSVDYLYIGFILALQNNDVNQAYFYAQKLREHNISEKMYMELTSFYIIENNKTEATQTLEEATTHYPDNLELLTLWIDSTENREKATRKLEQFLERNKNNTEARIKLYNVYYTQRQFRAMLTLAESTSKKEYTYMDDFYTALAWNMLGNKDKAIRYFNTCLQKEPAFIEGWFELGLLYENAHDYSLAQKIYSEGLRKNPNYPELWIRLIAINITLNKPRTALEYVKQGPQGKLFLLSAVTIFIENGYYNQATQVLEMIEKAHPDAQEIHFYYAFLFIEKDKNFEKALQHLDAIPSNSPLYPKSVQLKINIYQSKKEYKKAIEIARLAKNSMPELVEFWDLYAQTVQTTKDYSKAIEIYNEGLTKFPNSVILLYGLASVYHNEDDIEKAMSLMEKIIELDNDNIAALNYVGYTLTEKNEDLSRAKMLLEKAFFLDNENVSVLDSLGWLYYKQKRYYDAINLFNKAKEIGIEDPIIWEHYAEVAVQLGLKQEAVYAYKKVLEYNPKHSKAKEYLRK